MSLLDNSGISIISVSVCIDFIFSWLLVIFSCLFLCLVIFLPDARYCEFHLTGCWVLHSAGVCSSAQLSY